MTKGDEVRKALCKVLAEIAEREKEKSIRCENYEDALVAGFLLGLFKEAERSLEYS